MDEQCGAALTRAVPDRNNKKQKKGSRYVVRKLLIQGSRTSTYLSFRFQRPYLAYMEGKASLPGEAGSSGAGWLQVKRSCSVPDVTPAWYRPGTIVHDEGPWCRMRNKLMQSWAPPNRIPRNSV